MGAFDGELSRIGYKSYTSSEECQEPYYTPPERVAATIRCIELGAKLFEDLGLPDLAQQHREIFYRRFSIPQPATGGQAMNPYQLLFGPLWPTAPKHEQFPGRNPEPVPEPASLIDLTPEGGGRKPNTWYRKDFQNNCVNLLRLIARTPGLTRNGISSLVGRHGIQLVSALQGLHRCGYIHAPETVQGRAAWFITEKGNDYLKN